MSSASASRIAVLSACTGSGLPLSSNVGVVWRNIPKTSEYLNFHDRWRQLDGGTQQPLVERSFSETVWNADDFDTHGFSAITIRRTRRRAFLCSGEAGRRPGLPGPQTTCAL